MEIITVSPKYQVVIPKLARRLLDVKVGQKMVVIAYDNRIVLVPERPIQEARGSLKGIDTTIERDEEDRL
jgi:AbrB family looped-hinge helix DNA binding protein